MPTRTLAADGKTWLVFPSGRVTQYDRDEFGLIFVSGTGADARSARHALFAGRRRARASSSLVELTRRRSAAPVRVLAAERHVARSRLHGVTRASGRRRRAPAPSSTSTRTRRRRTDRALRPTSSAKRKRVGLQAIALTDHDTLDGIAEAVATGAELGVRVVPGVELSAVEGDVETHILGLHLSDTRRAGGAARRAARDATLARRRGSSQRLNELGVRIEFSAVLEQAAGGAIGRPHVARAMIAEGWAVDFRDAFDRYLGNGRPAFVAEGSARRARCDRADPRRRRPRDSRASGAGRDARAHRRVRRAREWMASKFAIRATRPRTWLRILALVEHFSLVPSGGSDWHGAAEGPRMLGHDEGARRLARAAGRPGRVRAA